MNNADIKNLMTDQMPVPPAMECYPGEFITCFTSHHVGAGPDGRNWDYTEILGPPVTKGPDVLGIWVSPALTVSYRDSFCFRTHSFGKGGINGPRHVATILIWCTSHPEWNTNLTLDVMWALRK